MTTAYRTDLINGVYKSEIIEVAANPSVTMESTLVSCPNRNCVVQYSLLRPMDATVEEIAKHQAAVGKAMQQQYCPHHPPKIELD